MGDISSIVSAGGSVLGPILGYAGQREANDTNVRLANDANAANQANAREQMSFQERMSNSAHTREVQDLKNAGLNPILSATGGSGASTPSGAMGGNTAAKVENAITPAITSAVELKSLQLALDKGKKEMDNLDETNKLIQAQTAKTGTEAAIMRKDIPKSELINDVYDIARPAVKSIKGWIQGSPRLLQQPSDTTNLDNYKKGMKTINLNNR